MGIGPCTKTPLTALAIYKPADVRPILAAYRGTDIPRTYAEREAADKRAHIEAWEEKKQKQGGRGRGMDVRISSLFSAGVSVTFTRLPLFPFLPCGPMSHILLSTFLSFSILHPPN